MRLRQRLVLLLEFLEPPHILDGNHGLVGEGRKKGDLLVGKRPHLAAANSDAPYGFIFSQQGCNEYSTSTTNLLEESSFRKLRLKLSRDVMDMYRLLLNNGPA